jgi:hypothetical protein
MGTTLGTGLGAWLGTPSAAETVVTRTHFGDLLDTIGVAREPPDDRLNV